jgi:two-component system phosphate regulon response regulator PhoB|tara:strand:- start:14013 stop:14702 length:690 start_codon:yes stop_codon:yes gene_type:complete
MAANILIVEDENSILELISINLHQAGFNPIRAVSAEYANNLVKEALPDLIVLDWMLPGMNGIEFAKRLRANAATKSIPIIMLTAKSDEDNKIEGLNVGDDYLTKPFSPRELVARIKSLIRRRSPELVNDPIIIENLVLDPGSHKVKVNEKTINIGPTEFKILHFFMKNTDRVYSRNHILDKIWGNKSDIDDRTVDVHIKRLRSILKQSGYDKLIQTVRGSGYRFSNELE